MDEIQAIDADPALGGELEFMDPRGPGPAMYAPHLAFGSAGLSVGASETVLAVEDAKSPADVAVIGTERDIERAITRLADAGATHFVANPAMFTTPEEQARTIRFLGSL